MHPPGIPPWLVLVVWLFGVAIDIPIGTFIACWILLKVLPKVGPTSAARYVRFKALLQRFAAWLAHVDSEI